MNARGDGNSDGETREKERSRGNHEPMSRMTEVVVSRETGRPDTGVITGLRQIICENGEPLRRMLSEVMAVEARSRSSRRGLEEAGK